MTINRIVLYFVIDNKLNIKFLFILTIFFTKNYICQINFEQSTILKDMTLFTKKITILLHNITINKL